MDKLITGIIIVAVVAFFYWLYMMDSGEEPMQGTDGAKIEMGSTPMDLDMDNDSMDLDTLGDEMTGGPWVAVVGMGESAHVAGHFKSYMECYQGVGAKVDVNMTPYSCTNL